MSCRKAEIAKGAIEKFSVGPICNCKVVELPRHCWTRLPCRLLLVVTGLRLLNRSIPRYSKWSTIAKWVGQNRA